jgi:FtsH-binding integral membrane protein
MLRALLMMFGILVTVAMLEVALWTWHHAGGIVIGWSDPAIGVWAVRIAALSLAAAAQVVVMLAVVGKVYQRRALGSAFTICAAMFFTLAAVGAVALGLAGH